MSDCKFTPFGQSGGSVLVEDVATVVHPVHDAGRHAFRASNHPALAWLIAHAFGNFFGAGVWGFMQTLPQINLYTHGTARVVPTGSLTVPDRRQEGLQDGSG